VNISGVIVYVIREPTSVVTNEPCGRSMSLIEKVGSTESCGDSVARPVLSASVDLVPS
jgi:hypothetical protein